MALFDAAEKLPNLQRFVFASSAAVYGMRSMYPQEIISEDVAFGATQSLWNMEIGR